MAMGFGGRLRNPPTSMSRVPAGKPGVNSMISRPPMGAARPPQRLPGGGGRPLQPMASPQMSSGINPAASGALQEMGGYRSAMGGANPQMAQQRNMASRMRRLPNPTGSRMSQRGMYR